MTVLRLDIELIPEGSWNNNLRNLLGKEEWGKLRKKVIKSFNYSCGICYKKSISLHCHEIWEYDDKNHIQKLEGLIPLCKMCHAVKHIGYAKIQSDRGELDWEKMIKHFMNVNKCERKTFDKYYQKAAKLWLKRSKPKWDIYVGDFNFTSL